MGRGLRGQRPDLLLRERLGNPPQSFSNIFRRAARAAGLPVIRFHDCCHSFATLALSAGTHPKIVSERLGHSSVSITLDRYSHSVPALEESAANAIAALIVDAPI